MARKSTQKSAAETLLDEQMGAVSDADAPTRKEADSTNISEEECEIADNEVVLEGAKSVYSHGISFKQGVPVCVEPSLKKYLMESGLFRG